MKEDLVFRTLVTHYHLWD